MQIGCGVRTMTVKDHEYLYFWHYEREGGRSRRKEDYIGRVDDAGVRQELLKRLAAYHGRAEQEIARRRARIERMLDRLQAPSS